MPLPPMPTGRVPGITRTPPVRRLLAAAAVPAAALLLASGCSSGDDDGDSAANEVSPAADSAVTERDTDLGQVYADPDGMTLYIADEESKDEILCTKSCLDFWEPTTLEKGEEPPEGFATVNRPDDGTIQLTFDDKPVYTFTDDKAPGDTAGDNLSDDFDGQTFTWHAVTTDGAAPAEPEEEDGDDDSDESGGYGY